VAEAAEHDGQKAVMRQPSEQAEEAGPRARMTLEFELAGKIASEKLDEHGLEAT
jgi:hypothetical protein